MKKFLLALGCFFAPIFMVAQTAPTDAAAIAALISDSGGVLDNATIIFNSVVTIVVAVVALGILLTFVKRVKRG